MQRRASVERGKQGMILTIVLELSSAEEIPPLVKSNSKINPHLICLILTISQSFRCREITIKGSQLWRYGNQIMRLSRAGTKGPPAYLPQGECEREHVLRGAVAVARWNSIMCVTCNCPNYTLVVITLPILWVKETNGVLAQIVHTQRSIIIVLTYLHYWISMAEYESPAIIYQFST